MLETKSQENPSIPPAALSPPHVNIQRQASPGFDLRKNKPAPEPRPASHWRARIILILASLVLLVYAFGFEGKTAADGNAGPDAAAPQRAPLQAYNYHFLAVGVLPAGFPKETILDSQAEIFQTRDDVDNTGAARKFVDYYSSSTVDSLYNLYLTSLPAKQWDLLSKFQNPRGSFLVFERDGNLKVIITPEKDGSQVQLDFNLAGRQ